MNLIKISDREGQQVVSARELHEFLGAATQFSIWAFRNILESGDFMENVDFIAVNQKRLTAQNNETTYIDYALTLDTAKEISMLQRSEKGKQARRYFIECEKKLKEVQSTSTLPDLSTHIKSVEAYLGQLKANEVLKEAQRLAEAEAQNQKALVEELAPKAEYTIKVLTSTSTYRVSQIALELNMSAIKLNTTLKEKGVQHKVNGQWCLNAKHMNKDYIDTSTYLYTKSDGTAGTSMSLVWTEKGRKFIHDLLNPNLSKSLKAIDE